MIEFFKEPNIDWMGKAKYFYALSAILLVAGWASILAKGGIYYGIDFKGGTNVDVRFAQPPNIDHLRTALTAQGLGNSEIQGIGNIGAGNSNEVLIFVGQNGMSDEARDSSKAQVLTALNNAYNSGNAGKPDINAATPTTLATYLTQKDPLNLSATAGDKYAQLAKQLLEYRDKSLNGLVTNFDDLAKASGATPAVVAALKDGYALGPFAIRNAEIVAPSFAARPFGLPSMLWAACCYILPSDSSGSSGPPRSWPFSTTF